MNRRMTAYRMALWCGAWLAAFGSIGLWAQAPARQPREFELRAESDKFWNLIARDAKLEMVADGFAATEGPAWDKKRGFLYVSDEIQNAIYRVYPDGRKEVALSIADPDGSTFDRKGRLISTASVLRAVIAVEPDGKYTVLADKYDGKKFSSPNDVVVGPDGAIYFTDPTLNLPKGEKQEIPFQGVYRLAEDGSVTLLTSEFAQPNGLAFSPDGRRFYVDDTRTREIRVYDFGPGATLTNGRILATEEGRGAADGMRVDRDGNLWVTGPLGIWIWSPEGQHLGTIVLPSNAANLAWGESDYRTIYITAGRTVYRLKTQIQGFVPYEP
jgi:gluconolactonase